MTQQSHTSRPTTHPTAAPLADRLLFGALLALLAVRPLLPESFERLELSFLAGMSGSNGPTPAASVWLDFLTLVIAVISLLRHWRPLAGKALVPLGASLLIVAIAGSTLLAGDKRLALNAGMNMFALALAGGALVRLVAVHPGFTPMLLGGLLASGVVTAAKCGMQIAYEFEDTRVFWQEQRQWLTEAGMETDSPAMINFERRMNASEAFGYLSHANLAGSCLMAWLLAAGGLLAACIARLAEKPIQLAGEAVVPVIVGLIVTGLAIGLWLTGSIGAFAALTLATPLLALFIWRGAAVAGRARQAALALGAIYALAIGAGALAGWQRGTLPHASLAFRWHYWTTAVEAWQDAPLTGIGRENFSHAYTRHKPAASTEEVRNPHNLWLALLVELGPLGLGSGVMLAGAVVVAGLRRLTPDQAAETPRPKNTQFVWPAVCFAVLHGVMSGMLPGNAAMMVLWLFEVFTIWLVSFVLLNHAAQQAFANARGRACIAAGALAAICGLLIHNLVGFSLITPGGLALFVGLAVIAVAPVHAPRRAGARPPRKLAIAVAGLLLLVHLLTVVLPTSITTFALAGVRHAQQTQGPQEAAGALFTWGRLAVVSDPWDPAPPASIAESLLQLGRVDGAADARIGLLEAAREHALIAQQRNPQAASAYRLLGQIDAALEEPYLHELRPEDAVNAIERSARAWEQAVERYPTDPRTRIGAALASFRLWESTDEHAAAKRAIEHIKTALRLDAPRPAGESVKLQRGELERLVYPLSALREAGFEVPALPEVK